MDTHIVIPKELFWQFKISPDTPIIQALDWALNNFISTNLDTKLKILQIGNIIERVMEYYLINNRVWDFGYFIRILNYSEKDFKFRVFVVKYDILGRESTIIW